MARISILVAAYNGGEYLRKCLDSLVCQTFSDFEAVCIDDASTDSSADIIAGYAARDSRFRLVRLTENGGHAKALNAGLPYCKGEFITFLDADDWYSADALQLLIDEFDGNPKADCVLFRCVMTGEDGSETAYKGVDFNTLTGREACILSFSWRVHGIYAARRELYERYPYDDTCRVYSDDNTTRVHYYISREVVQSGAVYYYLQHSASVSHKISTLRMLRITAADSMRRQLEALGCDGEMCALYETERWKIVVDCYYFYYKNRRLLTKEERNYCLKAIRAGWESVSFSLLDRRLRRRLGYVPMRGMWLLFRAEEEIYFFLRLLIKGRRG